MISKEKAKEMLVRNSCSGIWCEDCPARVVGSPCGYKEKTGGKLSLIARERIEKYIRGDSSDTQTEVRKRSRRIELGEFK